MYNFFKIKQGVNSDRHSSSLDFQDRDVEFSEARISLWHDAAVMSDNLFLGEIRLPARMEASAW